MENGEFSAKEMNLLKKSGFDVKNNLQDAYKTYKSPSMVEYKVHISLVGGRKYYVKKVGELPPQETKALSYSSLRELLESLEHRFTEVSS